jgi:hypothetical protein
VVLTQVINYRMSLRLIGLAKMFSEVSYDLQILTRGDCRVAWSANTLVDNFRFIRHSGPIPKLVAGRLSTASSLFPLAPDNTQFVGTLDAPRNCGDQLVTTVNGAACSLWVRMFTKKRLPSRVTS